MFLKRDCCRNFKWPSNKRWTCPIYLKIWLIMSTFWFILILIISRWFLEQESDFYITQGTVVNRKGSLEIIVSEFYEFKSRHKSYQKPVWIERRRLKSWKIEYNFKWNQPKRNWVFVATNSGFLIPLSLQPNVVDCKYFKL